MCVYVSLTESAGQRFLIEENSHDSVFFRDLEGQQVALIETHAQTWQVHLATYFLSEAQSRMCSGHRAPVRKGKEGRRGREREGEREGEGRGGKGREGEGGREGEEREGGRRRGKECMYIHTCVHVVFSYSHGVKC